MDTSDPKFPKPPYQYGDKWPLRDALSGEATKLWQLVRETICLAACAGLPVRALADVLNGERYRSREFATAILDDLKAITPMMPPLLVDPSVNTPDGPVLWLVAAAEAYCETPAMAYAHMSVNDYSAGEVGKALAELKATVARVEAIVAAVPYPVDRQKRRVVRVTLRPAHRSMLGYLHGVTPKRAKVTVDAPSGAVTVLVQHNGRVLDKAPSLDVNDGDVRAALRSMGVAVERNQIGPDAGR